MTTQLAFRTMSAPAAFALMSLAGLCPVAGAAAQKSAVPSGWVGISIIQKGHGAGGSGATTLDYPVIASVEPGSPAQSAGLVAGDTILAYNSLDANTDPAGVQRLLKPGEALVLKIRRNGVRNLRLTVARRSAGNAYRTSVTVSADETVSLPLVYAMQGGPMAFATSVPVGQEAPFAGSYFARVNPGLGRALSAPDAGVLVIEVGPGSAAMRAGLQAGDVVTRADSIAVKSPMEIATAMRLASGRSVALEVVRKGKPHKLKVAW